MRKFIVSICAILTTTSAMSASREPHVVSGSLATAWAVGAPYSQNVYNTFTSPEYFNNKSNPSDKDLNDQEGTYGGGEGAIIGIVARKIYANGGEFCATQIQAANNNMNMHSWIDYYKNSFGCMVVCKSGYQGETCDEQVSSENTTCTTTDFSQGIFSSNVLKKSQVKTSGKDTGRFTEDMDVFVHEGGYGSGDNRSSYDTLLGVVGVKAHGLVVAPVRVEGRRWGTAVFGNRSRIKSVYSNGHTTLLCAAGYVKQGDDCVKSEQCKLLENLDNMCPGYNSSEYNADVHNLKTKVRPGLQLGGHESKCSYFECKQGYGFKNDTSKECIECSGGKNYADADTGVCKTCSEKEFVTTGSNGKKTCGALPGYSKLKMQKGQNENQDRKCWMETDKFDFTECVRCPATNTWKDHRCQ
ncbi:MAG: hypothetical protein J6T57_03360 [Alphaproteobacteria bacterium]|nr:hypothetical protein [Alphaproteobacteria bacterium]